jgi:hypothetical protein
MDCTANSYEYRPLTAPGAIRLIELQPSADLNARLECILLHTTFDELNDEVIYHYCALSYVWGNPKDTKPIIVDGRHLDIGTNLATALRYLKHSTLARHLWADAICINQKDNKEKEIQVDQMGEVYKAALHTIIWLGEGAGYDKAESVLACICDTKKDKKLWEDLTWSNMKREYMDPSDLRREDTSQNWFRTKREQFLGLDGLVNLPWFTRIWIYQGLILSRDPWLQIGRIRARWSDVSVVMSRYLIKHTPKVSEPYHRFLAMDKAYKDFHGKCWTKNPSEALFDALVARRGLGVFDARDMIFAHLGILDPGHPDGDPDIWTVLYANYETDCSTLYRRVACHFSYSINIFEMLSHVEAVSNQHHPNTPSWVPNWRARPLPLQYRRLSDIVTTLRNQKGFIEKRLDDSNGSLLFCPLPKQYYLWDCPVIVSFLGFHMGTITRLSDVTAHDPILPDNENWSRISLQGQGNPYSALEKQIYTRWWHIFSALLDDKSKYDAMFRSWIATRSHSPGDGTLNDLSFNDGDLLAHAFLHETHPNNSVYPHFLYGRRLALVSGHNLAVVPSAARLGDVVCFFLEKTTLPFLLRPMSTTTFNSIDSELRDKFNPRSPGRSLTVNHFEFIDECLLEEFVFWSLNAKCLADLSGLHYPGTLEAFVLH